MSASWQSTAGRGGAKFAWEMHLLECLKLDGMPRGDIPLPSRTSAALLSLSSEPPCLAVHCNR